MSTFRSRPRALALPFAIVATFSIACVTRAEAAGVITRAEGANAAAIQATVDAFRTSIGGANNGVGPPAVTGRREINWDGVPDSFSAPNFLPPNFFNANSPRGVVFNTIQESNGGSLNNFLVSADDSNPTTTPVRFADINPQYSSIFTTFSAQRLFTMRNARSMDVSFFVPGTNIPAAVSAFGVVFADVDGTTGATRSVLRFVDDKGNIVLSTSAGAFDNGLSFLGVSFNAGERITRVVILPGTDALSSTAVDGAGGVDVVAMDDFIYAEPQSLFTTFANGFEN